MNKYTCQRCEIRNGVKTWVFTEDGFRHEVSLCDQCAEDTGISDKQVEFYKQLKEKEQNEQRTNNDRK